MTGYLHEPKANCLEVFFLERIIFNESTKEWQNDPIPSLHSTSFPKFLRIFNCGQIGVLSQVIFSSSILRRYSSGKSVNHLLYYYPHIEIYSYAHSFKSLQIPFINYTLAPSLFSSKEYWVHCYECPFLMHLANASFFASLRSYDWFRSILWRALVLTFGRRRKAVRSLILSATTTIDSIAILACVPAVLLLVFTDYLFCITRRHSKFDNLFKAMDNVEMDLKSSMHPNDDSAFPKLVIERFQQIF
ncbi:hypothetical protein [Cyanobium sp. Aljojuca 7D2]|uniref:hypothetical protein n=1 Tax=Cyanobium sp. Aljojuca 7D2 TaxID=2823698 RepID=UPI0020CFC24B|nr:hypothetical protein [Cyanobium sp. Aljojuca 7D2]